jgi:hypothetical protein
MTDDAMPRRIWTPRDDGTCDVCGSLSGRHSAVGSRCPHTAGTLTDDDVIELWRGISERTVRAPGITLTDCLEASPLARARVNEAGLYYPAPSAAEYMDARKKIADALNALETT